MTQRARWTTWAAWIVITWTFFVTIARTIRLPNDYAEAHWLLDYRFGFIKRGLIGSVTAIGAAMVGGSITPTVILVLSSISLAALSAVALMLLYRCARHPAVAPAAWMMALVLASSPFAVMKGHLLGYFDPLVFLLVVVATSLVLLGRPFTSAIVSAGALLVHETYFLRGLPLVAMASMFAAQAHQQQSPGTVRRHAAALSVPVLVFLALSPLQRMTEERIPLRTALTAHLDSSGFVGDRSERVPLWLTTPVSHFLRTQKEFFDDRLLKPEVIASVWPSLVALLAFVHSAYRIRFPSARSFLLIAAVCAPLLMHAVAWDTERISTYTIAGAFIAWWIVAETDVARHPDPALLFVAMAVLVLNAFTEIPLMDREVERFSPLARLGLYLPAFALAAYLCRASSYEATQPDEVDRFARQPGGPSPRRDR